MQSASGAKSVQEKAHQITGNGLDTLQGDLRVRRRNVPDHHLRRSSKLHILHILDLALLQALQNSDPKQRRLSDSFVETWWIPWLWLKKPPVTQSSRWCSCRAGTRKRHQHSRLLRSSLYFSARPVSRVFNEGPCLAGSMVASATQSSTSCSYSNQLMIPSNPGGILGVMVMPCGSRV